MPIPKENSKRYRALIELGHAQQSIQTAISLLGGWTRVRSVKKDPLTFAIRKMIESVNSRLNVIIAALRTGGVTSDPTSVALLNEFEREYDSTREPQC